MSYTPDLLKRYSAFGVLIILTGSCGKTGLGPETNVAASSGAKENSSAEESFNLSAMAESRDNSSRASCVEWRKKCGGASDPNPAEVAKGFLESSRKIIELAGHLPKTDAAILACSATVTGLGLATAQSCAEGDCTVKSATDAYNQVAKLACAANKCLAPLLKGKDPSGLSQIMELTCIAGEHLAKGIECNGYFVGGGGLAALCDLEIQAGKAVVLQDCPSSFNGTTLACNSSGKAAELNDISNRCDQIAALAQKQGGIKKLQTGNCAKQCTVQTAAISKGCGNKSNQNNVKNVTYDSCDAGCKADNYWSDLKDPVCRDAGSGRDREVQFYNIKNVLKNLNELTRCCCEL